MKSPDQPSLFDSSIYVSDPSTIDSVFTIMGAVQNLSDLPDEQCLELLQLSQLDILRQAWAALNPSNRTRVISPNYHNVAETYARKILSYWKGQFLRYLTSFTDGKIPEIGPTLEHLMSKRFF